MGRSKLKQLIFFFPDGTQLRGRGSYADFISAQYEKILSGLAAIGVCVYEEKPHTIRVQVLGSEAFFKQQLTERLAEVWEELLLISRTNNTDPVVLDLDVVKKRLARRGAGPKVAHDQAELTVKEVWRDG